jgi:hypothetical protein
MVKFVSIELLSVAVRLTIRMFSEPDESSIAKTQTKRTIQVSISLSPRSDRCAKELEALYLLRGRTGNDLLSELVNSELNAAVRLRL